MCARSHELIVYYDKDCPLCIAVSHIAMLEDKMLHVEYDLQTAKESQLDAE
jgi:predicted DCC family thiol-disulfide oxidoreductase YuxK